ncbi:MAG: hypothetical protein WCT04_24760, partial [Planctomycetota bacterium]
MKFIPAFFLLATLVNGSAVAAVASTGDTDNDFTLPANWGGVDPKTKPDETFVISAGHNLTLKTAAKDSKLPVKTIVVSKGAVLSMLANPTFDCAGKTILLDGGELNMERGTLKQLTLEVRADSTVRAALGGFDGGAITGKATLDIVRNAGNFRTLTLRNVDFSGCTGKIAVGAAMKGVTTLALAGTSRDLHRVAIDIRPPSRQTFTIRFESGVNMLGAFVSPSNYTRINLGNTACTFGHGSILGPKADGLAPGVYTPATTADYTQIPKLKGGFADLKEAIEPASIEGSSITILPPPEAKPIHRIDVGETLVLKEGDNDFSQKGEELLLNGGMVKADKPCTISGKIEVLNESVLMLQESYHYFVFLTTFKRGSLSGSGTLRIAGSAAQIVFEKDFDLSGFTGTITTEKMRGATELDFGTAGWGSGTVILDGKGSKRVVVKDGLETTGALVLSGPYSRLEIKKGSAVLGRGSRINDKEIVPGIYPNTDGHSQREVPTTWTERVKNETVFHTGNIDLFEHVSINNLGKLRVVDFKRVPSTASGGLTAPASWGDLAPNKLPAAHYEVAAGHTLHPTAEPWLAHELAIVKGGVLSLDTGNLDLGGRALSFHAGTILYDAAEPRIVTADLTLFDDNPLKDFYSGTLLLEGSELTLRGSIVGARNKQAVLDIRRTKPGNARFVIDGDMASVAPTGVGYDINVKEFAGHLDMIWTHGILNEGYIDFAPKSGTFASSRGFNSPRATIRLPANPNVKLDLKNATNTFQIGTMIGGVFIERGIWKDADTAGFTRVLECNTGRFVDLSPFLLNTKGAALAISNPRASVSGKEEDFDMDQIFAPDVPFNPETLKQLREQFTEEWVAPYRTALQTKRSWHEVTGTKFSHSDYTYGSFCHTMLNMYTAYKILGDDPAVFERMMVLADYLQQLVTLDPMATSSADERKEGLPCPAEPFTCASMTSMTLCACEIWKREAAKPGSVDKKLLEKADNYLNFVWYQNGPNDPKVGLKKYYFGDGKLDPVSGAPLCVTNVGRFSWNSNSGLWLPAAPFVEAIRYRKLATGKTDLDAVQTVVTKALTWTMDFFFRDNTVGEIDGKRYVWWQYNTTTEGHEAFVGNGPGWKDGLYKGMKIIKGGEDQGHCKAELLGFMWLHHISPGAYHLTDERLERIANGAFNALGCSPLGGLHGMFNPYRFELGDNVTPEGAPQGAPHYACVAVFTQPRIYRGIVFNAYKQLNSQQARVDWLWVKYL